MRRYRVSHKAYGFFANTPIQTLDHAFLAYEFLFWKHLIQCTGSIKDTEPQNWIYSHMDSINAEEEKKNPKVSATKSEITPWQADTERDMQSMVSSSPDTSIREGIHIERSLLKQGKKSKIKNKNRSRRIGEVAGGTTAECAAVCCCPCAILNLTILALVKFPLSVLKKKVAKRRQGGEKKTKKDVAEELKKKQRTEYLADEAKRNKMMDYLEDDRPCESIEELLSVTVRDGNSRSWCASPEQFWRDVTGNSHVGFWRNHSYREEEGQP